MSSWLYLLLILNQDYRDICGMPIDDDSILGRDKDGTLNEEYCKWCYADGTYTYNDMDELIDVCVKNMVNENFTEEQVRSYLKEMLPQLDYWKRYDELSDNGQFEEFKKQLMNEINDLHIDGLPRVDKLNALVGKYVNLERAYRRYIEDGSFPYILQINHDREMVREYLLGLYNTIVLKDVVSRRKITDVMMLQSVVRFLADNIGNISVIKRISDTMTSLGRKITSHTVENYVSALIDSYIFYSVSRFDTKGKQLLKTGQKLYLADIGLRNVINGTKGGDLGHILENVVYLELARRGGEIYVGKVGDAEIDFVVIKGEYKEYYQVSLSVRDENTMKRELAPLQAIQDHYPKYLLTMDNDPEVLHDGIRQIYVLDWLVEGD